MVGSGGPCFSPVCGVTPTSTPKARKSALSFRQSISNSISMVKWTSPTWMHSTKKINQTHNTVLQKPQQSPVTLISPLAENEKKYMLIVAVLAERKVSEISSKNPLNYSTMPTSPSAEDCSRVSMFARPNVSSHAKKNAFSLRTYRAECFVELVQNMKCIVKKRSGKKRRVKKKDGKMVFNEKFVMACSSTHSPSIYVSTQNQSGKVLINLQMEEQHSNSNLNYIDKWFLSDDRESFLRCVIQKIDINTSEEKRALKKLAASEASIDYAEDLKNFGKTFPGIWYGIPEEED